MAEQKGSGLVWTIGAGVLVAGGLALFLSRGGGEQQPTSSPEQAPSAAQASAQRMGEAVGQSGQSEPRTPRSTRRPANSIPESGRISVSREALREGDDTLALGLELNEANRGEGAHAVRIVDVKGRVLDINALPVDGEGTGLRLEVDPEWLRAGRYMVQVEVEDAGPLSIKRYVLEVTEGG